jgi:tetratricopeptide (TPR) repeat protein
MLEKRVAAIGKLSFGLAGLFAGDPKGAASVAEVAAGVIDRARATGKEPEAVFARTMAEHRRVWAGEYAGDGGAIESVEAVLEDSLAVVFDPEALTVAAFKPDGLYAAAAATVMRRLGLDDPRQHSDAARRYAAGLIAAGLEAALEAGGLAERFRDRMAVEQARQIGVMQRKLDGLGMQADLPRALLENLALRFEHARPDASVGELMEFLKAKATEWKELKARLAALEAADPRIANARAAAEAAIAVGDFDGADAVLAGAEELQQEHRTLVEVRRQVELRLTRAGALLLKSDADGAATHIEKAAGFLLPFAPEEAAVVRHAGAMRLYDEALRLGGTGLLRAVQLYRRNEAIWTREAHPVEWAATQYNLSNSLQEWGTRIEGAAGPRLLAEAVSAYREALEVHTRAEHPMEWAITQNSLATTLRKQAARTEGPAGNALLAEAVAAHRAALEVYTRAAHRVAWAMTQNSLGNTLRNQAARTEGPAGARLLAEAVAAYRAALEVRTRGAHPVDWAATQNNLGLALAKQASGTEGSAAVELLVEAVAAFRAALEVRTRAARPVDWAGTQTNLGSALRSHAMRTEGPAGDALVAEAVAAYRAALEVYTRAAHPMAWGMTQNNLGNALGNWAGRSESPARAELLAEAVAAFRAALEVRTRRAHPDAWATTQNNLGNALAEQARTKGHAGVDLLLEAVEAYRAALEVWTRDAHPADSAMAQTNLGVTLRDQAALTEGPAGAELLAEAVVALRAALEVRTQAAHPVVWAITQEELGLVFEAMADRGDEPARRYAEALGCLDAALTVLSAGGMKLNWIECARSRARVAWKMGVAEPSADSGAQP